MVNLIASVAIAEVLRLWKSGISRSSGSAGKIMIACMSIKMVPAFSAMKLARDGCRMADLDCTLITTTRLGKLGSCYAILVTGRLVFLRLSLLSGSNELFDTSTRSDPSTPMIVAPARSDPGWGRRYVAIDKNDFPMRYYYRGGAHRNSSSVKVTGTGRAAHLMFVPGD